MSPKQQSKTDLAKKQKIVEDKTFRLKKKNKSKNVQKYVKNLKQSVQPKADPKVAAKKWVIWIGGVDPKSILREFYKVECTKGFKCKYSHDLNIQRKGQKIDIYSDKRDQETMEEWDQKTLEKVVESKKMEYNQNKPTHIIVAKWDSELYVKVDDDVHVNLGMLATTLARHLSKLRVYIGYVKYHEPGYWKFGEEGE